MDQDKVKNDTLNPTPEIKEALQDEELDAVSGGTGGKYTCIHCGMTFTTMIKAQKHVQECDKRPGKTPAPGQPISKTPLNRSSETRMG